MSETTQQQEQQKQSKQQKQQKQQKQRGDHCLNVFVSHELKANLKELATKYDRTTADIVRAVLRIGIPMMEGLSRAEEVMVREYVQLFRKLRQVKALKEI